MKQASADKRTSSVVSYAQFQIDLIKMSSHFRWKINKYLFETIRRSCFYHEEQQADSRERLSNQAKMLDYYRSIQWHDLLFVDL